MESMERRMDGNEREAWSVGIVQRVFVTISHPTSESIVIKSNNEIRHSTSTSPPSLGDNNFSLSDGR